MSAQSGPYLSLEEALAYVQVSEDTLYRFRKAGLLSTVKLGRRVLYPKPALDALCSSDSSPSAIPQTSTSSGGRAGQNGASQLARKIAQRLKTSSRRSA